MLNQAEGGVERSGNRADGTETDDSKRDGFDAVVGPRAVRENEVRSPECWDFVLFPLRDRGATGGP